MSAGSLHAAQADVRVAAVDDKEKGAEPTLLDRDLAAQQVDADEVDAGPDLAVVQFETIAAAQGRHPRIAFGDVGQVVEARQAPRCAGGEGQL